MKHESVQAREKLGTSPMWFSDSFCIKFAEQANCRDRIDVIRLDVEEGH